MRRLLPSLAAATLACTAAVTGLSDVASASQHTPAQQLLSDALNAANDEGSVHFVDKTTVNKTQQVLEGAISAPTAGETLGGSAPLEVELIGGFIYVQGSAAGIQQALAITAAQAAPYAGKWIVVQPSDAPFQLLSTTLTLGATIDVFTPGQSGLRIGKAQTVGHTKVLPVYGAPSNLPKGSSGSAALLVSAKAPHLPVGGTLVIANKTGRLNEVAVFNDWGATVKLTAPTGGTPFSTLLAQNPSH